MRPWPLSRLGSQPTGLEFPNPPTRASSSRLSEESKPCQSSRWTSFKATTSEATRPRDGLGEEQQFLPFPCTEEGRQECTMPTRVTNCHHPKIRRRRDAEYGKVRHNQLTTTNQPTNRFEPGQRQKHLQCTRFKSWSVKNRRVMRRRRLRTAFIPTSTIINPTLARDCGRVMKTHEHLSSRCESDEHV